MNFIRCIIFMLLSMTMWNVWANSTVVYKKPIKIVVSFTTGGDTDVIARAIAQKLSIRINQSVTVLNKPGAGGIIGNNFVANSENDGTILLLTPSTFVTSSIIMPIKYDIFRDFTPIIKVVTDTQVFLGINAKLKITNVQDLIKNINNGTITSYSTPGNGSPMHMIGEYFKYVTNTNIEHVPYQGNSPAIISLLSGEVPFAISSGLSLGPYYKNGTVNIIGVAAQKRSPFFPNVLTLQEQGLPLADFSGWFALLAPNGIPKELVQDLNMHINEILKDEDIKTLLTSLNHIPGGGTSDEMKRELKASFERFSFNLKTYNVNISNK